MIMPGLRDVEIRHLQALQAVAQEGTFARAADRLGYTQSAVSQQIAAFERLLGEPLFDRPGGPRPVELTPLGRILLDHANTVLARVDAAADEVERFRAGQFGRLDVGTFQSVSVEILPHVVGRLLAERPQLEVRPFESDANDELLGRVADGSLDLTFAVGRVDDERFESIELAHDPFVVIAVRESDEPAAPIPAEVLRRSPLVGQQPNSCQYDIDRGLRSQGIEPSYVFRSNDNAAVQAMVRAGMGLAVMPLLAVDLDDPRIAVHPMEPALPDRVISLVRLAGRTPSPAAVRFTELAVEECQVVGARRERLGATLIPTPLGSGPRKYR
jgi:DNA-binding transcriptional LysR family regulator